MKNEIIKKHQLQKRRRHRVRHHMHGTAIKPRLSVTKSNKHIHVQLIDDERAVTLAARTTASKEARANELKKNKESARKLGETIGKQALEMNIKEVIFDRGAHRYHGILAELADGAREAGLKF